MKEGRYGEGGEILRKKGMEKVGDIEEERYGEGGEILRKKGMEKEGRDKGRKVWRRRGW